MLASSLGPAWANDDSVPAGAAYRPADFEQFAPRTALDMVEQIPGFRIRRGEEARGLGQADDNVLINGRRISGKSNDAVDALRRIPADAVERLEVRDGATLGIPGLSGQVVNVVARLSRFGGNWRWRPEFREGVDPSLQAGEITLSGTLRGVEYTLSFEENGFRNGARGPEEVFDAAGALIDLRDEDGQFYADRPQLSLGLGYITDGGVVMNVNAQYGERNFTGREFSLRSGPGLPDRFRVFEDSENEWNAEIGGDIEFGLGAGRLKLIGLQRMEDSPSIAVQRTQFADGAPDAGSRFSRDAWESESILRSEYSWVPRAGVDWQVSLEGAFNVLDIESGLERLDASGDFRPVPLPNSNSRVEERRAEANVTHSRPLPWSWAVQTSLGAEYSELSQDGAFGQVREFVRPKGFVAFTHQPTETLDVRLNLERSVGQISFFDFIASVDLGSGNQSAGNPELVPPQSWELSFEATQNAGAWGSVTGRVFAERITDIIDVVPIGDRGQGLGNLDEADRYGLEIEGTFNLDPFGLQGARLDFEVELVESRLEDPLTGLDRPISDEAQTQVELEFRHDIEGTDWAWGASFEREREEPFLRLDEIRDFTFDPYWTSAFVEHKDVFGATVQVWVGNLVDASERFDRTVFVDRRDGPVAFVENRDRTFGQILRFTISSDF
ncbi:TonB-dependent receptor plug domain-containing protein [Marinicauda salina]|uniref:TonB-dependent receptor plug domain-containing protein n=1 Tax=Marinicauda salina TaxID=2135793 RepID=UPI0013049591|nr:TonB-dependent receptor [Marinicauda salina]